MFDKNVQFHNNIKRTKKKSVKERTSVFQAAVGISNLDSCVFYLRGEATISVSQLEFKCVTSLTR